jgi:hypothetical protein
VVKKLAAADGVLSTDDVELTAVAMRVKIESAVMLS